MATGVLHSSQQQAKLGPFFLCFTFFESLHGPYSPVKRRQICQTCETSQSSGLNKKQAWLACKKGKNVCPSWSANPLGPTQHSICVSSSYCPSYCPSRLELWIPQTTDLSVIKSLHGFRQKPKTMKTSR